MKTIKLTVGMKLILIAVITIIGISLFSAFKQSEGSKKYLTMTEYKRNLYIVDEKGLATEKKIAGQDFNLEGQIAITKEINYISSKGYKLISHTSNMATTSYTFEKE